MKNIILKVLQEFREPWRSEIHHYLSQSVDLCDLETRIKTLRNGGLL